MKAISKLFKNSFQIKIKSFFISDGKSKIILARQFTEMTYIQLQSLNSLFIRLISSLPKFSSSTVLTNKTNQFLTYQINIDNTERNNQEIYYFVLVTSVEYNIIDAENLLKSITRFIFETTNYKYAIKEISFLDLIKANAFNIILGLDDMINPLLGNEGVTVNAIASNLKMESRDEKVFVIEKNKKIDKAHDDLIKGMEEIDKLKYANRYMKNGISNEDIENAEREADLRESQVIIEEISRERLREQIDQRRSMIEGLNLQRHFLNRLGGMRYEDRESMDYFVNSCENVVQQMMIREMKRMQGQEDHDNSGMNLFSGPKLIITPIQFFYSNEDENDE